MADAMFDARQINRRVMTVLIASCDIMLLRSCYNQSPILLRRAASIATLPKGRTAYRRLEDDRPASGRPTILRHGGAELVGWFWMEDDSLD
jgi:hypothetical protein